MRGVRGALCAVLCAAVTAATPSAAVIGNALPPVTTLALADLPTMNRVAALDELTATVRGALASSNRYLLTTWWDAHVMSPNPAIVAFNRQIHRGTIDSEDVRRYSSAALALAVPLATRSYSASVTGVPASTATDRAVTLVQALVRTHVTTIGQPGWGGSWQSPLWASQAALAGWLLGPSLPAPDQLLLARMLEYEADTVAARPIKYLRDRTGKIVHHGDSGSEEMAWSALGMLTAVELLPRHPRRTFWADHAYRRFVAAYSRPEDVSSSRLVNGRPLNRWLGGSNVEPSGVVINHGRISPDYTVSVSLHAAVVSGLVGNGVPAAVLHGHEATYRSLSAHSFGQGYQRPGGTVYRPNSSALYYPMGADWGTDRQVVFGVFDLQVAALGLDRGLPVPARKWAGMHLGHVRKMQARFKTGQTYGAATEDTYWIREEWTGALLAYADLTEWLRVKNRIEIDHRSPGSKLPQR